MNTQTATTMKTVEEMIAFVVSECTAVDREARFDQMLDDSGTVEVAGLSFWPSVILKECDPVAYRCGLNDWADGEGWIEIEGENYESDDVEKAREEFMDEMRSELSDLESELEALNEELQDVETDDLDEAARDAKAEEVKAMESRIAELERYAF